MPVGCQVHSLDPQPRSPLAFSLLPPKSIIASSIYFDIGYGKMLEIEQMKSLTFRIREELALSLSEMWLLGWRPRALH